MITRLKIAYEAGLDRVDLSSLPVIYSETDFFDQSYTERVISKATGYNIVRGTRPDAEELTITIQVRERPRADFYSLLDKINFMFSTPSDSDQPGSLWCGDQYIECFPKSSEMEPINMVDVAKLKLTFVPAHKRMWVREETILVEPVSLEEDLTGFKYPYKFPYRYSAGGFQTFVNATGKAVPFILSIFGPAERPTLSIGGIEYGANISLLDGERLIIDSRTRTVEVSNAFGDTVSRFDARVRNGRADGVFTPIPTGRLGIANGGGLIASLTLLHETTTPLWVHGGA